MRKLIFVFLICFMNFQLLCLNIPYQQFELIDEKKAQNKVESIVGWLYLSPEKKEAVLVKIDHPDFTMQNQKRIAIKAGRVSFINPNFALFSLPWGLYSWKSKTENLKKESIDYKDVLAYNPQPIAWSNDEGKPGLRYISAPGKGNFYLLIEHRGFNEIDFSAPWIVKEITYPSTSIQKMIVGSYPEIIQKVKSEVDRTVPDKINVEEKDPITQYTIQETIEENYEQKLPYVLLRTVIPGPYYHYYDAQLTTDQKIMENKVYHFMRIDPSSNSKLIDKPLYYITFSDKMDDPFYQLDNAYELFGKQDSEKTGYQYFVSKFLKKVFAEKKALDEGKKVEFSMEFFSDLYNQSLKIAQHDQESKKKIEDLLKKYFDVHPAFLKNLSDEGLMTLYDLVKPKKNQELYLKLQTLTEQISKLNYILGGSHY